MLKKKVFAARNLKIAYQIYHSKQEKQKRKSKFFYLDNFMLPCVSRALVSRGLVSRALVSRGLVSRGLVSRCLVSRGLVSRGLVSRALYKR
jgi:hypothetical protein